MNKSDQTIAGADALRRAVSWRLAVAERQSMTLVADVAVELVAAISEGEVLVQPRRARANDFRGDASDARSLRAKLDSLRVDRGSLHAWFARTPAASSPPDAQQIGRGSMIVSALEAVEILTQRRWTDGELERHYARRAHVEGWRCDNAKTVERPQGSRAALDDWIERIEADDALLAAGVSKLMALSRRKGVNILGRGADGHMRGLEKAAAFAPDITLDIVAGRFRVASHISPVSGEWEPALAACQAIGEVFFYAGELEAERVRFQPATSKRERDAVRLLRDRFREWVEHGGRMCDAPKQADWLAGEGIDMVGSKVGAARAWAEAVASDPAFAALHKRGRRPNR